MGKEELESIGFIEVPDKGYFKKSIRPEPDDPLCLFAIIHNNGNIGLIIGESIADGYVLWKTKKTIEELNQFVSHFI